MTRIKKGLLAVLLCVMAIALGVSSLLMFRTTRADEISDDDRKAAIENLIHSVNVFSPLFEDEDNYGTIPEGATEAQAKAVYDKYRTALIDNVDSLYDKVANWPVKDAAPTYNTLWSEYKVASTAFKSVNNLNLTDDEIAGYEGLKEAIEGYNFLNTKLIFGDYNVYASRISVNMLGLAKAGYEKFPYAESVNVYELYNLVNEETGTLPSGAKLFIRTMAGTNFKYLYAVMEKEKSAYALAKQREDEVINPIMVTIHNNLSKFIDEDGEVTGLSIKDKTLITDVDKLVDKLYKKPSAEDKTVNDIDYLLSDTVDYKADVKLSEDATDTTELVFKTEYAKYVAVKDAYGILEKAATDFEAAIAELYENLKPGEKYYTHKSDIEGFWNKVFTTEEEDVANISIDDLIWHLRNTEYTKKDTNKTKIAYLGEKSEKNAPMATDGGLLDEMMNEISDIEDRIAEVVKAIDAVKVFTGTKYTGVYEDGAKIDATTQKVTYEEVGEDGAKTLTYRALINKAMDMFNALDKDIIAHEEDAYSKNKEGADPAVTYWVSNYEDLVKAKAEYDAWDAQFKAAVAAVQALADVQVKVEAGTNEGFNRIQYYNLYATALRARAFTTAEIENVFNSYEITAANTTDKRVCPDWLAAAESKTAEVDALIGKLDNNIGAYTYTFSAQSVLVGYLQEYNGLSDSYKNLLQNKDKLLSMQTAYANDLAAVAAWQKAVAEIVLDDGKISIVNMDNVTALKAVYEILANNANDTDKTDAIKYVAGLADWYKTVDVTTPLTDEEKAQVADKSLAGEDVLTAAELNLLYRLNAEAYNANIALYTSYVTALDELNKVIGDIEKAYKGLLTVEVDGKPEKVNNLDQITVKMASSWYKNVDALTGKLDVVKGKPENDLVSYKGILNEKEENGYVQTGEYAAGWANYKQALNYVPRYRVEGIIADIWNVKGYEYKGSTPLNFYNYPDGSVSGSRIDLGKNSKFLEAYITDFITLAHGDAIEAARDAFDKYKGEVELVGNVDYKFVRNYNFLLAAEARKAKIAGELDTWRAKVLGSKDVKGLVEESTIKDDKGNVVAHYGLDLTKWTGLFDDYAKLVGGIKWNDAEESTAGKVTITAYVTKDGNTTLNTKVYKVLTGADQSKIDYCKTAFDALMQILIDSNNDAKAFDALLAQVLTDVSYQDGVDGGEPTYDVSGLEIEDYEKIANYRSTYNSYIKGCYQKDLITNWAKFDGLEISAFETANAFNILVKTLYDTVFPEGVEAGNAVITEFTQVYVEYVKTIYAGYSKDVHIAIGSDYANKLAAIEKAIEAAQLPDYAAQIEGLQNALTTLQGLVGEKSVSDQIAAAIETLQVDITTLKANYSTIAGKLDGALTDITTLNKNLSEAIATLTSDLAKTKGDLEEAYAKADTELKKELNGNIKTLEDKLTDLINKEETARLAGDKTNADKLAQQKTELEKAINDAKTALTGDIKTVSDAVKVTETKIAQLETELGNVKTELGNLSDKIDKMQSSITGLTVGIIIVAIATAAALAGVIVIFIKKKN